MGIRDYWKRANGALRLQIATGALLGAAFLLSGAQSYFVPTPKERLAPVVQAWSTEHSARRVESVENLVFDTADRDVNGRISSDEAERMLDQFCLDLPTGYECGTTPYFSANLLVMNTH